MSKTSNKKIEMKATPVSKKTMKKLTKGGGYRTLENKIMDLFKEHGLLVEKFYIKPVDRKLIYMITASEIKRKR